MTGARTYGDGGETTEDHCKAPNLGIRGRLEELDQVEGFGHCVCTIGFDAGDDPGHFTLVEEVPALFWVVVWERHEEEPANDGNDHSENAFHDKLGR